MYLALSMFLLGGILGAAIDRVIKPRREIRPALRKLLDDFASAVSRARVPSDINNPDVLSERTQELFASLIERYYKELKSK